VNKIFFSDLDGTLLTSKKEISEKTRKALDEFVSCGNRFAICTGRGLDNVIPVAEKLGLNYPGMFLVCFNGAEIYDWDKKTSILHIGIPFELIPQIFGIAERSGIHCHTYTPDYMITPADDEEIHYYNRVIQRPYVVTKDIVSKLPMEPCKVIGIELHDHEKMEAFRKEIDSKLGDRLTTVYSNPYYLEIFMKEAGKGSAVLRLSQMLGIRIEDTIAAGDEKNDISMIEAAGVGIAMINASEEVRKTADVVTAADNDHDGLAEILRSLKD